MIEMADEAGESSKMGDPLAGREAEASEPRFTRGANDLVISLSSRGRSIRLFTAEGDHPSTFRASAGLDVGLGENVSDV